MGDLQLLTFMLYFFRSALSYMQIPFLGKIPGDSFVAIGFKAT